MASKGKNASVKKHLNQTKGKAISKNIGSNWNS